MNSEIIEHVLENEGVFSDHEHDPGSKTIYGVASTSWPNWYRYIMEAYNQGDYIESQKRAIEFYQTEIASKRPFDRIEAKGLQALCFDMHVNHSFRGAGRTIQKALNFLAEGLRMNPLTEDGWMGNKTVRRMNALNRRYGEAVVAGICGERYNYYKSLVQGNSNLKSFIRGWVRRTYPPQL